MLLVFLGRFLCSFPYTSGAGRGEGCPDILTPPSKNEETIQPE
jgi:hypothetical protein